MTLIQGLGCAICALCLIMQLFLIPGEITLGPMMESIVESAKTGTNLDDHQKTFIVSTVGLLLGLILLVRGERPRQRFG